MITGIFLTIGLIILNGFFVAAEFSMVKARKTFIENSDSKFKKYAIRILSNVESYISATQLGITIASLALGWVGESTFEHIFDYIFKMYNINMASKTISVFLSFSLVTSMHIIFGELIPKSISIKTPNKYILFSSGPVILFYTLFKPIIYLMNKIANHTLNLFGYNTNFHEENLTEEEVLNIVDESINDESTKEIITNAFVFNEKTVREIMVPRTSVVGIEVTSKDEDIVDILKQGYTRLPVYYKSIDSVSGIVNAKDILMYYKDNNKISLTSLIKRAYIIPETMLIKDLLQTLKKKKLHMAIVVDEHGGMAGIVTLEDILEEIVGDIQDEYDNEDEIKNITKLDDTTYDVLSETKIDELQDILRYPLPEGEDFDTVSGLVNFIFKEIPKKDAEKEYSGFSFKILKATKYKIIKVRIKELLTTEH